MHRYSLTTKQRLMSLMAGFESARRNIRQSLPVTVRTKLESDFNALHSTNTENMGKCLLIGRQNGIKGTLKWYFDEFWGFTRFGDFLTITYPEMSGLIWCLFDLNRTLGS